VPGVRGHLVRLGHAEVGGDPGQQVNNPDPFAVPVWRSPVYHTPGWIITIVQAARGLKALGACTAWR
jgi:hypothetical protein